MNQPSQPPPSQTLLAAAAGGFGGAVLGVIAATMLTGDGEGGNKTSAIVDTETTKVELVASEP